MSRISALIWTLRTRMAAHCLIAYRVWLFNTQYGAAKVAEEFTKVEGAYAHPYTLLTDFDLRYINELGTWSRSDWKASILSLISRPFKRSLARHGLQMEFKDYGEWRSNFRGLYIVPMQP